MTSPFLRRKARQYLVQAIYQWQMTQAPLEDIVAEFLADHSAKKFDVAYFQQILFGVVNQLQSLDQNIENYAKITLKELDPIEFAILRLATYELLFMPEVPYRVVINEAVELTKRFGATDAHKFVNGVLDKIAQHVRAAEKSVKNT